MVVPQWWLLCPLIGRFRNEPGALDEVEVIWARGVKALFGFSLSVEG